MSMAGFQLMQKVAVSLGSGLKETYGLSCALILVANRSISGSTPNFCSPIKALSIPLRSWQD